MTTIKKLEESDHDTSTELSESFELYLEQKKKRIEVEKKKVQQKAIAEYNTGNDSLNDESFLELEKICENTLNINNVSEILTDLTTLDLKNESETMEKKINAEGETAIVDIEQPSFTLENSTLMYTLFDTSLKIKSYGNDISTIMEKTETSYKTSKSELPSTISTEKSTCYITANDKSLDLTNYTEAQNLYKDASSVLEETLDIQIPSINDTLDEIDFLLAEAKKVNENKKVIHNDQTSAGLIVDVKKSNSYFSQNIPKPTKHEIKQHIASPKQSPLITFSPNVLKNSPSSFKCPKQPLSHTKAVNFSKINNKKFQHIVSPISRYIQTSESVLNSNAHIQYKTSTSRRHFNFRDSENFEPTLNESSKVSSLPLRAKTNFTETKSQVFYF